MNACKIFLAFILIMSVGFQNISSSKSSDKSFGFFHDNIKTIHHTINKIFTLFNLRKSFKKSIRIRLLITMHKNLLKFLRNTNKYYETENSSDNTTIKEFSKHDSVIDEILEETNMLFIPLNETMKQNFQNHTLDISFSEDFSGYIADVLSNKYKSESQNHEPTNSISDAIEDYPDIINRTANKTDPNANHENSPKKSDMRMVSRNLNLKAWVPDAYQSYAFNRRIYRGRNTNIKKYPFLASVHESGDFVCAGSLISKDHIITAASCLQTAYVNRNDINYKANISVRIGSDYTDFTGQAVPIAFIHFHPSYHPQTLKNNLAILIIGPHKEKKQRVRRVLFDKTPEDLPSDVKRVTIVGWGGKGEKHYQASKLSLSHLDLYDLEECKVIYSNTYVSDTNFCAGYVNKGSGACKKDIGDPALIAGVLVGVVSFGPPVCGTPDAPTVFTRVGRYSDWLDSVIKMDLTAPSPTLKSRSNTVPRVKSNTGQYQQFQASEPNDLEADRLGIHGLGKINVELPEEFFIMKQILKDIAKSNSSGIKSVIDQGFDDEFLEFIEDHPNVDLQHHPLANKSIFAIPGVNFPEEIASYGKHTPSNPVLTVPSNLYVTLSPQNPFKLATENPENERLGQMVDMLYAQLPSSTTALPLLRTDTIGFDSKKNWITPIRSRRPKIKRQQKTSSTTPAPVTNEYLHFDLSSSDNYESTDSEEGMSIEVAIKRINPNRNDETAEIFESAEDDTVPSTPLRPVENDDYKNYLEIDAPQNNLLKSKYLRYTKLYDYHSTRLMEIDSFQGNEKDDSTDLTNYVTDPNDNIDEA